MEETEQIETSADVQYSDDRSVRKLLFKKRSTSSTCAVSVNFPIVQLVNRACKNYSLEFT